MAQFDDYERVSVHLTKTLIRLSSDKQGNKYAILTELYKYLFGVEMQGDQDNYLVPLEKASRTRPP